MRKLTQKRLKELLHYDPETGVFRWRISPNRRIRAGTVTGGIGSQQYLRIGIDGRVYLSHRLAWLYMKGCWPIDQLDHINGIKTDNRQMNLRGATSKENGENRGPNKNNSSGYHGVAWHKRAKNWQVRISVGGERISVGHFNTTDEAYVAYLEAKAKFHKFQPTMRTCGEKT